ENAKTAWQLLEEQYQAHLKLQPEHEFEDIAQKLSMLHQEKITQQEALNETDAKLRMNANNQNTYAKYQQQIEQIKAEEYRFGTFLMSDQTVNTTPTVFFSLYQQQIEQTKAEE